MIPEDSSSCVRKSGAPGANRFVVVVRDLVERVRSRRVAPDLAEVGVVADVLLDEHVAAVGHRDVVEHLLALGAVERPSRSCRRPPGWRGSANVSRQSRLGALNAFVVTK